MPVEGKEIRMNKEHTRRYYINDVDSRDKVIKKRKCSGTAQEWL